jgi:hypothetical protein
MAESKWKTGHRYHMRADLLDLLDDREGCMGHALRREMTTTKLAMRQSSGDWFAIEHAEHDGSLSLKSVPGIGLSLTYAGRFSDADVEGTAVEMFDLAAAILMKSDIAFKRCAVRWTDDGVEFWSPRNTMGGHGRVSHEEATRLAKEMVPVLRPLILAAEVGAPPSGGEGVADDEDQ